MTALHLALRCAALYTEGVEVTALGAVDATLFTDALSAGLADYWQNAPDWVKAPWESTNLATVANSQSVVLPTNFEQLLRPPRIRSSSTSQWVELQETPEPLLPVTTGTPAFYRVRDNLLETPVWDEAANGGNTVDSPLLLLYPTPNAVYSLDVQARYHAPRIRAKHLSGALNTINLPVPEHHIVTMVVPLCAQHFLRFPHKKASLTAKDAAEDAARGFASLSMLPARRGQRRSNVGTPLRY